MQSLSTLVFFSLLDSLLGRGNLELDSGLGESCILTISVRLAP